MSTRVVIGGWALNQRLTNGIDYRTWGIDSDFIATYEDATEIIHSMGKPVSMFPIQGGKKLLAKVEGRMIEVELAWPGSLAEEFSNLVISDVSSECDETGCMIPSLDALYALKMSHRFLRNSPHFVKTRQDILAMRSAGATYNKHYLDWFKRREEATYNYAHPKLNVKKDEFFAMDLGYVYDHDSIHESVKCHSIPAYQFFKDSQSEVMCSRDLFDASSETVRLNAVIEESMVLAIERSLVPHPGKKTAEEAYIYALQKVCTSITSGWFRRYAWDNYDIAAAAIKNRPSFWVDFQKDVLQGKVKLYEKPNNHSFGTVSPLISIS